MQIYNYMKLFDKIALNVICRIIIVCSKHRRTFSTWRTRTGSSNISPSTALSVTA